MRYLLKLSVVFFLTTHTTIAIILPADFEIIIQRIKQELVPSYMNDAAIESLINALNDDGTWPDINYNHVAASGQHSGRLVTLARAYNTKSSRFFKDKKVKDAIILALEKSIEDNIISDNWWYNEVSQPSALVELMLLIGEELPENLVEEAQPLIGRAHIDSPGARPGGDRMLIASIQAKNLLFTGDNKTFEQVIKVIENEIKYVESNGTKYGYTYRRIISGFENREAAGRGLLYDNSFHHRTDGVNMTLSYGLNYANSLAEWAYYTAGTQYSFSNEKLEQLIDFYLDGICKMSAFGRYPDPGVVNRDISRKGSLGSLGARTAERLLVTSNYRKNELQEIADIRNKGTRPTTSHATYFWKSEHFSFQRPDFFTSVRMYSTRAQSMENAINREGLLNHHRGDGANHISITGDEYYDIWPVYDYQKIPGTTIMQKPELPATTQFRKVGLTDFVGAVTDGKYGAAAFDFKSPHDPLCARKAWFFFDDEYVCLGAGISCREQLSVVTTLNQCLLRDDVTVSSQNKTSVIPKGEGEFADIDWIYHDGIGYVFPKPETVNIKNSEAKGSWRAINQYGEIDEISLDVFKLWINHGERPSDESYEYIIVPSTSVENMKENNSKNNIAIISNTPYIQAVINTKLGICQVVFYKAGKIQITEALKLKASNPGIIMIKMENDKVNSVSVADPNRTLGRFYFSVSGKVLISGDNFMSVWDEKEGMTHVSVKLPDGVYAGKSVTVELL